jgi:hypothetical protein
MASQPVPAVTTPPTSGADTRANPRGITDPWYQYRGPLNNKFLELRGSAKHIFEALGGGDAFIRELRREPEENK